MTALVRPGLYRTDCVWDLLRNVRSQSAALWVSQHLFFPVLHLPAGDERADADHRLAGGGGLCWELVWKGEVSTAWLTVH